MLEFGPHALVAQRIEYWPPKPRVVGSNPAGRARYSSKKGKNAMPPKGGNLALTDADVNAAVDYMVGLVK